MFSRITGGSPVFNQEHAVQLFVSLMSATCTKKSFLQKSFHYLFPEIKAKKALHNKISVSKVKKNKTYKILVNRFAVGFQSFIHSFPKLFTACFHTHFLMNSRLCHINCSDIFLIVTCISTMNCLLVSSHLLDTMKKVGRKYG